MILDLVTFWIKHRRSQTRYKEYFTNQKQIQPICRPIPISTLTPAHIDRFVYKRVHSVNKPLRLNPTPVASSFLVQENANVTDNQVSNMNFSFALILALTYCAGTLIWIFIFHVPCFILPAAGAFVFATNWKKDMKLVFFNDLLSSLTSLSSYQYHKSTCVTFLSGADANQSQKPI